MNTITTQIKDEETRQQYLNNEIETFLNAAEYTAEETGTPLREIEVTGASELKLIYEDQTITLSDNTTLDQLLNQYNQHRDTNITDIEPDYPHLELEDNPNSNQSEYVVSTFFGNYTGKTPKPQLKERAKALFTSQDSEQLAWERLKQQEPTNYGIEFLFEHEPSEHNPQYEEAHGMPPLTPGQMKRIRNKLERDFNRDFKINIDLGVQVNQEHQWTREEFEKITEEIQEEHDFEEF